MTETRPKRRPWVMRALAIATIIAVPALLLGVNHLLSREFVEIRELRQAVDQSYSTRAQLMRLLSLHQDLETGQRGYVLTGRSMFLAPYIARIRLFRRHLPNSKLGSHPDRLFGGGLPTCAAHRRRRSGS